MIIFPLNSQVSRKLEFGEKDIRKIVDYFEDYIKGNRDLSKSKENSSSRFTFRSTACARFNSKVMQLTHIEMSNQDELACKYIRGFTEKSGLASKAPTSTITCVTPSTSLTKKQYISHRNRLKVCHGAVQSKLSFFDKRTNPQ